MIFLHHRKPTIRLANWIGRSPVTAEERANVEHKLDQARAWLRHGERGNQLSFGRARLTGGLKTFEEHAEAKRNRPC